MILAMLSHLLWASSLKVLKDFCVMAVARERSTLVLFMVMPTGRPTPLGNVAIEIPPVITVDVIRFVFTMLVVVLNRFIFLANSSRNFISSSKYALISVNFLKRYVCGSCGAVVFNCCFIVIYAHLFNSWSWRMSSRMSSSIPSAIKIVLEAINV